MENQDNTGAVGVVGTIVNAVEHPIDTIEGAAGTVASQVEGAAGYVEKYVAKEAEAVKVELESLVDKVKTFFQSTSTGHLSEALIAMATRIEALEQTVAGLGGFLK